MKEEMISRLGTLDQFVDLPQLYDASCQHDVRIEEENALTMLSRVGRR
jgi:hypothetical protein